MEFCRGGLYCVLVVICLQTIFCLHSGNVRDESFSPSRWSYLFDHYLDHPYGPWRRKSKDSPFRNYVPTVQDSLQTLQRYIDSDIRDYTTSIIVDMKFNVIDFKRAVDAITMPKESRVMLTAIGEYDTLTFAQQTGKGTFYPGSQRAPHIFQKIGFKSSFGVTRLAPFTQVTASSDICLEDTKEISIKECILIGNHSVECEWKLGVQDEQSGRAFVTLEFKILYELSNGSTCVRETRYMSSVAHVSLFGESVSRSVYDIIDFSKLSVFELFPRVDVEAQVNGTVNEGRANCPSNCTNRSPCKCEVKFFRDPRVFQKLLQMVLMGLSLASDGRIQDDTSYRPVHNRTYHDFLLYWNELTMLDLSDLSLKHFNNDYLTKVENLNNLNLGNTGIQEIPEGLLDLYKLKTLNLSGNVNLLPPKHLTEILEPLKQVQNLDLSHLPLRSLNNIQELLTSMKLQSLYLRNCSLMTVNKNLFPSELINLDLSENPLGRFPQDLLVHFPQLASLSLSSINLQPGLGISLGGITLEKLDLSRNNIESIDNIIQSGFVDNLNLKGNQIKEWFREDMFLRSGEPWVRKVNLAENQMALVTKVMGKSFQSLEEIELADNPFDCTDCRLHDETRKWLLSDKGNLRVTTNGREIPLLCGAPEQLAGHPILLVNSENICAGLYLEWLWLMVIPFIIIIAFMVLYAVVKRKFRIHLKHMEYLEEVKKINRKRAIALCEKHFEYDVYLVYCPEDADFANHLKVRLEKVGYRVLISKKEFDAVSDEVQMSRHVVVVVTNNFKRCEIAKRGVERVNFWILSGDFHNIILLMIEGVNEAALSGLITLLKSHHDHIYWQTSLGEDEQHFQKLLGYLGPSNYATWKKALQHQLEEEVPSTSSKFLPQKMHDIFTKMRSKEKNDVEHQVSSLL